MIEVVAPDAPERDRPAFDQLLIELIASPGYTGHNALVDYLRMATWHPALELSTMMHANRVSGKPFACYSYYCDDPATVAYCAKGRDGHLATISISFVRRLVKICDRLGGALGRRPRIGRPDPDPPPAPLPRDPVLSDLLSGKAFVTEAEALEILARWPAPNTQSAQIELGEYALFHDLIRLIWLHEWAHGLCGHVDFAADGLGLMRLHEWSADRVAPREIGGLGPQSEVMQALEVHADEFATRYCVGQILGGYDPIGQMAGPRVDLIDRLLMFNVACCVFAVIWALAERQFHPGQSFIPRAAPLASNEPDPMFVPLDASHPPAELRYYRFRSFQRDLAAGYGEGGGRLAPLTDAVSLRMLDCLAEVDGHFYALRRETPMLARTPTMKRLEAYEEHLMRIGAGLGPILEDACYPPTRDPYTDDEPPDG